MRRVWVIRGGEENHLVDDFVAGGVIGVGYPDVPDGTTVDRYDVTERLRAKGWTNPEARAELLQLFVHQVRPGHLVVMPDTARREVVIGRIEGDYEFRYDLSPDEHRHRRPVTWLGRHAAGLLPESCRDLTRQRTALAERSTPALIAHAEGVERGEIGRDPLETTAPSTPAAPRAARTRATSPTPKPKQPAPPQGAVCDGCFLRKSADLFPDGGTLCVDCA